MKKKLPSFLFTNPVKRHLNNFNFKSWILEQWFKNLTAGSLLLIHPSGYRQIFEGKDPGPDATIEICDFRRLQQICLQRKTEKSQELNVELQAF